MNKKEPPREIPLFDQDPVLFERMILCMIDGLRPVYDQLKDSLCRSPQGLWKEDFVVPGHNAVYKALADYYRLMAAQPACPPISEALFRTMLTQQASGGSPYIGLDELDDAVDMLREIRDMDKGTSVCLALPEIGKWLGKQRMNKALQDIMRIDGWDPDVLRSKINEAAEVISFNREESTSSFGDAMDQNCPPKKRYPMPNMPNLSKVLGGGLAHGEYSLFLAGQGGGKTVMALQLATTLALHGLKVLFITTEQEPAELEPRIVSARCNIPFDKIKDGVDSAVLDTLTGYERTKVRDIRKNLDGFFWFKDWNKLNGASVMDNLDDILNKHEAQYGKLDAVIFDWLGGGLGVLSKDDMHIYRLILDQTSEFLGKMAPRRNLIIVGFAQVNLKQAWNRRKVDQTMTAECKSMGKAAYNVYGISCLMAPDADIEDVQDAFLDKQYVFASKSRKSRGLGCDIYRDFEFQRFTDRRPTRRPSAV